MANNVHAILDADTPGALLEQYEVRGNHGQQDADD
jgi:hypothetical protein